MKVENEKVGLKLNIQKMIMASGPITSWEIDRGNRIRLGKGVGQQVYSHDSSGNKISTTLQKANY